MQIKRSRNGLFPVYAALTAALLLCSVLTAGCGNKDTGTEEEAETQSGPHIVEVQISGANFYDYFDYKEYPNYATDEDGNINACNLSYGFSLHPGLTAVNDGEHESTLEVSFKADGIAQYGEFDVNFQTLSVNTVAEYSRETEQVMETLLFWPQGNRTVSYPYGTLSSTYIIRLYNFTVTSVGGTIWLWSYS